VSDASDLPRDLAAAHAMILVQRERLIEADAGRAKAQATALAQDAFVLHLKLEIEKLQRALYGSRSERKARLLDQLEIQLEDVEADAAARQSG
jgi:transposase